MKKLLSGIALGILLSTLMVQSSVFAFEENMPSGDSEIEWNGNSNVE